MEIGILDNDSYRSVQIAQASFILSMRDLARIDPICVACLFKITKDEARRLAETPVHVLEKALHSSPPILTIKGQDGTCMRGVSPMSALLASLQKSGTDAFHNAVAHINAYSGQVNNGSLERDQGNSKSAVAR
jgi:hypothetical protein